MSRSTRTVIDTNVIVSGLLFPHSVPARALLKAETGTVLVSAAMRHELLTVFSRSRFDRCAAREARLELASAILLACEEIEIITPIRVCRDSRDDKFLEAAIHGRADAIITGDSDLLALDPFHGVRILTPSAYLDVRDQ